MVTPSVMKELSKSKVQQKDISNIDLNVKILTVSVVVIFIRRKVSNVVLDVKILAMHVKVRFKKRN